MGVVGGPCPLSNSDPWAPRVNMTVSKFSIEMVNAKGFGVAYTKRTEILDSSKNSTDVAILTETKVIAPKSRGVTNMLTDKARQ